MQRLEALFANFAKRTEARWWVGERPDVRVGQLPRTIAGRVGYPTSGIDPFACGGIIQLGWGQAAHVLAVAGTTSLVFGDGIPARGRIDEAKLALTDLAGDAVFYGNGLWGLRNERSWQPLTSATFDCGLLGYDAANAFIFWVEEED